MGDSIKTWIGSRLRTMYYIALILPPFFSVVFSSKGLGSHPGRLLIWGKVRRIFISFFPPLAHYLQARSGVSGGCDNCGASCKLLFQCPHWDDKNSRCSIYEFRPSVCRLFPITPADIRDRNLVNQEVPCGFRFNPNVRRSTPTSFIPDSISPKFPR